MRRRLSGLLERLRASLWLAPLVALILALVFGVGTIWFDELTQTSLLSVIITNDSDAARAVLSVVATSMLAFTGLVFTITIVVLQLAASQFSPRITRAFLRERQTKITMALFLGTFAYSLLVLRSVRSVDDGFIPTMSVGVTYLLVFASLIAFISYLDHIAQTIRVSNIVRRLGEEGVEIYERCCQRSDDHIEAPVPDPTELSVARIIEWDGPPGVLSYIDERGLAKQAAELDVVAIVIRGVGDFVPNGAPLVELHGLAPHPEVDPDDICADIAIGADRTPQQDLALPLRHLTDIALRALSPGINDPTTAVQAIDYMHDLLRRLTRTPIPARHLRGPDGKLRLIVQRPTWDSLIALALTELRLAGASQIQVVRRVLHMLDDLLTLAGPEQRGALEYQRQRWLTASADELDLHDDRTLAHQADAQGLGSTH